MTSTTYRQLEKKHGQYKISQVKYLASLYELIEESYSIEELQSIVKFRVF